MFRVCRGEGARKVNYVVDHIPKGKIRPGTKMVPTSITIHSTGNPSSTAKNERDWLVNLSNTRIASWHIAVDEKMAVEAVPLDEVAYHAGTSQGNNTSIGIEICESGDRAKTLANAARLVAELLKGKGWGVDRLRRHHDWSGKICPRILADNGWAGWEQFKADLEKELNGGQNKVKVNIKGKDYLLDGFMKDNTNYVPIRAVAEALGYKVSWDKAAGAVVIK